MSSPEHQMPKHFGAIVFINQTYINLLKIRYQKVFSVNLCQLMLIPGPSFHFHVKSSSAPSHNSSSYWGHPLNLLKYWYRINFSQLLMRTNS